MYIVDGAAGLHLPTARWTRGGCPGGEPEEMGRSEPFSGHASLQVSVLIAAVASGPAEEILMTCTSEEELVNVAGRV